MQSDIRASYGFELYERSVARRCVQVLTKKYGPADQIDAIWIVRDPGSYWPENVLVRGKGLTGAKDEEMLLQPSRAGSDIPESTRDGDAARDQLLRAFPELAPRLKLDSDSRIPGLFLAIARLRSVALLRKEMAEAGYRVPGMDHIMHCTYEDSGEMLAVADEPTLWKKVESELRTMPVTQEFYAELASICYAGVPERLAFLAWTETLKLS